MPFGPDEELEALYCDKKLKLRTLRLSRVTQRIRIWMVNVTSNCMREASAELRLIGTEGVKLKRFTR
jgi:hypothetical protein